MSQDSAAESYELRQRRRDNPLLYSFTGGTAPPADRRGGATRDANVVQNNSLPAVEAPQPLPGAVPEKLRVEITVNRICRMFVILWMGFLGGWSLIPDETKVPTTKIWVTSVVIITNSVALTTAIDNFWPHAMDWYFRTPIKHKTLVVKNDDCILEITGYELLSAIMLVVYLVVKWVEQNNGRVLAINDIAQGVIAIFFMSLFKKFKWSDDSWVKKWFFTKNYSSFIWNVFAGIFAFVTWWWIAIRIVAIVVIIRNRHNPDIYPQFIILTTGLACEGISLVAFMFNPLFHCFFDVQWDPELWASHSLPIVAMVLCWIAVPLLGWFDTLPLTILLPCSGKMSTICSTLTAYAQL